MSLLILLPLISLASFVFIAQFFLKLPSASLGAGFVMWLAWTGVIGRALSLSSALDSQAIWVLAEMVPLVFTILIYPKSLTGVILKFQSEIKAIWVNFRLSASKIWALPILLMAVVCLYSVGLVANLTLPQVMDDSLTAYLARAGFWISNQSTEYFRTSDYNFPLVSYPALPTFSTLRWIVLTGGDHAASLDQWLSTLISGTLVFSLARKAKTSAATSMFVALIWLLMPVTLLQSQMVLYDAVALVAILTALIMTCELFIEFRRNIFLVGMLAVLVAMGTKQTVIFMLPSAVIALTMSYVALRKTVDLKTVMNKRLLLPSVAVSLVGLVISLPEYILNLTRFGHPLGPRESFGYFADSSVGVFDRVKSILSNSQRVVIAGLFGDTPPNIANVVPDFFDYLRLSYSIAGTGASRAVGVGWYGFSATLIILFALTTFIIVLGSRQPQLSLKLLVIGGALYSLLFMYTRSNFSEAFSRYMWFPLTLFLVAGACKIDSFRDGMKRKLPIFLGQVLLGILAAISIGQGSWSFLGNGVRPLIGSQQVWSKSDGDIIQLSSVFIESGAFVPMVQKLNTCDDPSKPLGIYLPFKFPLSILFGDGYDRDVKMIDLPPGTVVNRDFLASKNLSALIIDATINSRVEFDVSGLWSQSYGQYTLLRVPSQKLGCH